MQIMRGREAVIDIISVGSKIIVALRRREIIDIMPHGFDQCCKGVT